MTNALYQAMIDALRTKKISAASSIDAKEITNQVIERAMDTEPANDAWLKTAAPKKQKKTKKD